MLLFTGLNAPRHTTPTGPAYSRRFLASLGLVVGALVVSGCAGGININHAADPDLEPSRYLSYSLLDHNVGHGESDQLIARAVHRNMETRGFSQAAAEQADLLVSVKVLTSNPNFGNAAAQNAAGGGAMGGADVMTDEMMAEDVEKLVLVQLMEGESRRVVWVGWATAKVAPDKLVLAASDAVSRIMVRVPRRVALGDAG